MPLNSSRRLFHSARLSNAGARLKREETSMEGGVRAGMRAWLALGATAFILSGCSGGGSNTGGGGGTTTTTPDPGTLSTPTSATGFKLKNVASGLVLGISAQ